MNVCITAHSLYLLLLLLLISSGYGKKRKSRSRKLDECKAGKHDCHKDAYCYNTRRSFRCKCKHGFYGNGKICIDEDECEYENGGCVHHCSNTHGNYTCSCMEGFQLAKDAHNCIDMNECFHGRGGCQHQCINTLGSYECKCNAGFSLQPDGKSCSVGTWCQERLGCAHHCHGSSVSCACREGYRLHSNDRDCIATCAIGNGGCQHRCGDESDGPLCSCHDKYTLQADGKTCIASCGVNNGGCDRKCRDSPTGPVCGCTAGYLLHQDGKTCLDTDECMAGNGGCSHGCVNTHGSYECICPKGFKVHNDQKTCMDIDECEVNTTCDHNCVNTPGTFHCLCREGYQRYGLTHCADKNECSENNGGCQHICTNEHGRHLCYCRHGYMLHSNKRDCVAVKCLPLKTPAKSTLDCNSRIGRDQLCKLRCHNNAHLVAKDIASYNFQCGPGTGFRWSHEIENKTMPTCSESVAAPSYKRKATFFFMANQCSLKKKTKQEFQDNLNRVLIDMFRENKKLRCPELCHVTNISLQCGTSRSKFRRMSRRTGQSIIRAEFELKINPQTTTDKCDVDCVSKRTEKRLKRTLKTLRKTINKAQLIVRLDGQTYGVTKKSLKTSGVQEECGIGQILIGKKCVSCSVGSYYDMESRDCLPCESGTYQDREGQLHCKTCPHGKPGVGTQGARNTSDCEGQCVPGTFSEDGGKPCYPCPMGTYQPEYGRSSCKSCGRGVTTRSKSAVSFQQCIVKDKCKPGYYYDRDGGKCMICAVDTYQPETGQDFCIDCPGTTTTDLPGAINSSQCKDRGCGGHIGQYQGFIQSPNWPGDYPTDVNCTWEISPEKGRRILVVIPEIFLASQDKCGDILVMRKSASPYSLTTYETCESTETPIAFTARSRKLWIHFRTNGKNSAAGFSIPFVTYNEEYQDLIEDIVRDGRLYSSHQHQEVLKDRKLLSALLEVIAQPYNYFKYANVSKSMFPESFIRLLTPKVRRFFT